ncbi:MAG: hypothetical protein J7604_18665 [Sporocytophaga sp.]|uniref:hypothetical protein n=1 Tax=Sporocytophaga sp. TaxID=2231183 RepID=UPI001B297869|nr:hypothetical protein [Sporocytophaga sp.]MBO9702239.1 hypothetical protein [Sporocytophaga sp.]
MQNNNVTGSFDVAFFTEKDFRIFGKEFAKCYANMNVNGYLEKPLPKGNLTYEVKFNVNAGCDTILKKFQLGYDKTFENKKKHHLNLAIDDYVYNKSQELIIYDDKFTAELISCGRRSYSLDKLEQIRQAHQFFPEKDETTEDSNNYIDKDGLVQFIVAGELASNPEVMAKITSLKKDLIAMVSIATNYVNKIATDNNNPAIKKDPVTWYDVLGHLPLIGPSKLEAKTYARSMKGITIAKEFLDFIMNVVTADASGALNSFKDFLSKQGEAINIGIENNSDTYNTVTISIVVEVMEVKDQIIYLPKIKMYSILFTRDNSAVTTSCGSYESVNINFNYQEVSSLFDYEGLENPEIKKIFEDFINGKRKAQIEDADTFFNDDFETQEQTPVSKRNLKRERV